MKVRDVIARAVDPSAWDDCDDFPTARHGQASQKRTVLARADAILAALRDAGLAVVPMEATRAMAEAGNINVRCRRDCKVGLLNAFEIYYVMVAAAMEDDSDRGGI